MKTIKPWSKKRIMIPFIGHSLFIYAGEKGLKQLKTEALKNDDVVFKNIDNNCDAFSYTNNIYRGHKKHRYPTARDEPLF